jgi:tight adherence protein C
MTEQTVQIVAFSISGLGLAWATWIVIRTRLRQRRPDAAPPVVERAAYTMSGEAAVPAATVPAPHAAALPSLAAAAASSSSSHIVNGDGLPHEWPDWYPASKRRSALDADRLPLVEAGQIPVADTSDYVFGPVTPVLATFLPDSDARKAEVRQELMQAGMYQPHAQQNRSAVRYALIMGSLLLFGGLLLIAPARLEMYALGGTILMPILGWAVPRLYVKSKAADRKSAIERGMPDMLDMLYMCVSQGMTMPNALKRTKQELAAVYPELHQELDIVTEQAEIGNMRVALQNFADRINVPEVNSFSTLMVQTEQMGTSVSQALVEYSDGMRGSLRQRADEKANKASFKLLFPTVLCLMPAVYIFLLGPSIVKLHKFFSDPDSTTTTQARQIIERTGASARPQVGR